MSIARSFVGEIFHEKEMMAPWPPNVPVRLGDVGVIRGGLFTPVTTLTSLGIDFKARTVSAVSDIDYTSTDGVTMVVGGRARAPAAAKLPRGSMRVTFERAGGIVLRADDVIVTTMDAPDRVATAVITAWTDKKWDKDWSFVDQVHTAKSTTVIVSQSDSASVDLRAEADGTVASLSSKLVVTRKTGKVFMLLGGKGLTPMFRLQRVRRPMFAFLTGAAPQVAVASPAAKRAAANAARPARVAPSKTSGSTTRKPLLEEVGPARR